MRVSFWAYCLPSWCSLVVRGLCHQGNKCAVQSLWAGKIRKTWVLLLTLPLTSSVTWSMSLYLTGPLGLYLPDRLTAQALSALMFWLSMKRLCSVQSNMPGVGVQDVTRRNHCFELQSDSHRRMGTVIAS